MKKRIRKASFYFIGGFFLLFAFRYVYSATEKDYYDEEDSVFDLFENISSSRHNYASYSYKFKEGGGGGKSDAGAPTVSVDQKYEKVADVGAKTESFDETESRVRSDLKKFNTVIQFEQKSGNKGSRSLVMMIGVRPESFDSLFTALKNYGSVRKAEITKIDKTSEFKALNARKASLEKTREALITLKKQNGHIDEFIKLEDRILEIEDTLQFLGVSLGDFDLENEFCTIRYSLSEGRPKVKMSVMHRIKVSLEWSVQCYISLLIILCLILVCSFILLFAIDKLKILQMIVKKINKDQNPS